MSNNALLSSQFAPRLTRRSLLTSGAGLATATIGLTGCSSGSSSSNKSGTDPNTYKPGSASLKVQIGDEISGPVYPDPWKGPKARKIHRFGDNTTEFRVLTRAETGLDLETNTYSTWLEKQTGVKVKYETVPMGDEGAPKINAMIAGGDLPDAFMIGPEWMGGFTRSQVYLYGQQGLFQPLDRLVDEYAPQLLEMFRFYPDMRDYLTTPSRSMYSFPAINDCYHCKSQSTRTWINAQWLEKIGADVPNTADELRTVLKAFKKQNPSGLSNAMPCTGSKDQWLIGYFMQSFLYTPKTWLALKDGKVTFTPTEDGFREGLRYIADLVKDGLFDKAAFTQTGDQVKRRCMNKAGSLVGMTFGNTPGVFCDLDWTDPHARFRQYTNQPPVTGPSGHATVPWEYTVPALVGLVITRACKDPQTLVQWADAQLGLVPSVGLHTGPEGKGFTWAKEGQKGIDGRQGVYEIKEYDAKNVGWDEWGPYGYTLDVRNANVTGGASVEPLIYKAGKISEPFASPKDAFFRTPYYTADQASQIGELRTNLQNYYTQATTRFCLGQDDISDDSTWKAYKAKFDQIGVKQYLQVNEEALQNK